MNDAAFQLTRPRGTRPRWRALRIPAQGFNSRVREGRDPATEIPEASIDVSTHASARDATPVNQVAALHLMFQLTRPRGTRPRPRDLSRWYAGFNSRVREGRDQCLSARLSGNVFQLTRPRGTRHNLNPDLSLHKVSTHASARDATNHSLKTPPEKQCFNSRVREGRDRKHHVGRAPLAVSTHASARDATRC